MLGVKWCDHVKNVDVAAANGLPIIDEIKSRNALFGHIVRLYCGKTLPARDV